MAKERIFLGLYSGESADGVDAAAVAVRNRREDVKARQVAAVFLPYPEPLRKRIVHFASGHAELPADLARLGTAVGEAFAEAVRRQAAVARGDVAAVGCSGQRLALVNPDAADPTGAVLSAGNPEVVAARTRMPVACDFEAADLAAGGIGGPLTAWSDWRLFRHRRLARVVVHLGGMASVTLVPAAAGALDVVAFDTGPGTLLIDALTRKFHHRPTDTDGHLASQGVVGPELLHELEAHPYFRQPPPKRTTRADWHEAYLWRLLRAAEKYHCAGSDLIATATELTARTVATAVAGLAERPHEVLLAGGGARNIHLAGRIRSLLSPSSTYTVERYDVAIRGHMPVCYALLAAARRDRQSVYCPQATGADRPSVPGRLILP